MPTKRYMEIYMRLREERNMYHYQARDEAMRLIKQEKRTKRQVKPVRDQK